MADNYVQKGDTVTVTSPAGGVVSGQGVQIGEMFGVATHTAAAGADLELARVGVFALPCNNADDFTAGALAYWDSTAEEVVTASTANKEIGFALAPETAAHVVTVVLVPTVRANIAA